LHLIAFLAASFRTLLSSSTFHFLMKVKLTTYPKFVSLQIVDAPLRELIGQDRLEGLNRLALLRFSHFSTETTEWKFKKLNETQQKIFRATFGSQTFHIDGSVCTDFTPFYAFCIFSTCAKKAFADTTRPRVCVCFLHLFWHAHTGATMKLWARQCAFNAGVRGELFAKFPEHSHQSPHSDGVHVVKCKRKVNFFPRLLFLPLRRAFAFPFEIAMGDWGEEEGGKLNSVHYEIIEWVDFANRFHFVRNLVKLMSPFSGLREM
jgi:hypothetical protein